jgi:hypothetical protein
MRSTRFYRQSIALITAAILALSAPAQQKASALTGVNWIPVTGNGAPTANSCGGACTSAFYGLPYTDLTNNNVYTYTGNGPVAGWVQGNAGCTGISGNYPLSGQIATVEGGCITAIGTPFSMGLSCPQAGQYEVGHVTTNPFTCTMTYANGTPASGFLSDGTNSVTLTTPFTSGSLAFTYSVNTTFTAHAVATNLQTASATAGYSLAVREFGGIGTAGATGATASGNDAVLVGATGTLATVGLGQHSTWGPYLPNNQKIYVLGTGSACTFTSGGFNFPMNTPIPITFINQNGSSVPMFEYESANLLSAQFTLNGTC